MASPTLSPAPLTSPVVQSDGTAAPTWQRWFQQLQNVVRASVGLPFARYTTAAGQSIPNSAMTVVNFGTQDTDSYGLVTTGAGWKFTVPAGYDGLYLVNSAISFNAAAAFSSCFLSLLKNGSEYERAQRIVTAGAGFFVLGAAWILRLQAGDYVQVGVDQTSGGAQPLETAAITNWVTIAGLSLS